VQVYRRSSNKDKQPQTATLSVLSFVTVLVEAVFAFLKSEPPNAFLPGIEHFFAFSPTNPNRVSFMWKISHHFFCSDASGGRHFQEEL
jgi:hypothetical protein